ncbi:ChaC-like protein [Punctularia strigosozonata HHB-11173 SS5]|uniref:ChaC-like protein n=1 Tax=Punctularia strigosozonata (strain HHB-11173) TaxID=741275 RepID=UPI00044165FA|nr:ChaC-like protein [Punctularia strigosozonata HHB-11173 SS5]EIN13167.1 ChaC-like protein [Punctularia strigosozonata HHB-11173 SS5]
MSNKPYIVFGYGSLIFKPPPHAIRQVPGYLKGYVRRFAQKSHDHRGTPESPGRVVTLIHKEDWDAFSGADPFPDDDIVWGVAYTIDPAYEAEVRDYLDYREKVAWTSAQDGYTLEVLDVYGVGEDGQEKVVAHDAECYVGRKDNPSFIGSEPLEDLAQTIWRSVGPSGPNKEYLYRLAHAVRELAPHSHDSHLFALETRLRELDAEAGLTDTPGRT